MLRTTGRMLLLGALVAGASLVAAAGPAPAADLKKDTSLAFVPADAAFYATMLRNKEQVDLLYKSNAYKTLRGLPLVEQAWKMAQAQMSQPGGPLEAYKKFTEDPANKELIDVLAEGASDEIFLAGGTTWVPFTEAYAKLQLAQYTGMLKSISSGGNPNTGQFRGMLLSLQRDRAKLKVPGLVVGMKVKDTKRAEKQVARLYKMADAFIKNSAEVKDKLGGKLKQEKLAGGTFVTLELDGGMLPWDQADLSMFEEKKGEFDDLINHAKKMKLTVSVGVAKSYLVFSVTATGKEVEAILGGKGKLLADRDELMPVVKNQGKKLVSVGYTSPGLNSAYGSARGEVDSLVKELKAALKQVPQITEERAKAIGKDLDELAGDLKSVYPANRAGTASYSYLTETGYEGYAYDYNDYSFLKGTKLTLHNHFGGDPIFGAAFAMPVTGDAYKTLVKWAKKAYGHGEAIFMEQADQNAKDAYKKVTQDVFPLLKKLDEATTKQLIPALKDGGLGVVIDGKWKSKAWVQVMPKLDREMPLVELGLLLSLSDGAKFTAAMTEYRKTLNDLYAKLRENAPDNIPEVKIPAPDVDKSGPTALYSWPLPEDLPLDRQVRPTAGVGKTVAALALSKKHAERLVSSVPLKVKSGPLATKKALIGAMVLDWPGLVDLAMPWVEFSAKYFMAVPDDEEGAKKAKAMMEAYMKQVKVAAEVMKTFRSASSATYLEGKGLVTHSEVIIKDLPKVIEVGK